MKSKKWKGSKSVLPLLLSVMMIVEPLGPAITVRAEEMVPPAIEAEIDEQEENVNVEETLPDSEEVRKRPITRRRMTQNRTLIIRKLKRIR